MTLASVVTVIDASVAVKWAVKDGEDDVDNAMWLLERHARGDLTLAVPGTFRLEWLNALMSRRLEVLRVLNAAVALSKANLWWHEVDEALSFEAIALASTHGLTVYDAVYLALAERLDAGLLTADRTLAKAAGDRLMHVVDFKFED